MMTPIRWFRSVLRRVVRGQDIAPPPAIGEREIDRALEYEARAEEGDRERDSGLLQRVKQLRQGSLDGHGPPPDGGGP